MGLKSSYQKLVTTVSDLENEKAELLSEVEQLRLLSKYNKTDFAKERDEFQAEISELQLLVEDLRTQVENIWLLYKTTEYYVGESTPFPGSSLFFL